MPAPRVCDREVEYDKEIDSKARLVALVINQKRLGDAASAVQKVFRSRSSQERLGHGQPPLGKRGSSMPPVEALSLT